MSIVLKVFFIGISFIVLSGCSEKYIQSETVKQQNSLKKEKQTNTEVKKEKYQFCKKHLKIMNHASSYVLKEFQEGYFKLNDTVGAKAQVFLIQSNSPTIFAQNINSALKSYEVHYNLAKKYRCDIQGFQQSPLNVIQKHIEKLETKQMVKSK